MNAIQFLPVTVASLPLYTAITGETLWYPVWPGEEWLRREYLAWPPEIRQAVYLVYDGSQLVGRVIAPQFEDFLLVRDLGLRPQPGLAERVVRALLGRFERRQVRYIQLIAHELLWRQLGELGFAEQRQRVTMRLDLRLRARSGRAQQSRSLVPADAAEVGELLYSAYAGSVDDHGEDLMQWTDHARDVFRGQYGPFLSAASLATPALPPFDCETLLVECASHHAVLGQVATRRSHTNRGLARLLIDCSLDVLMDLGYEDCFLEVTLANANALHLYRSLGFTEVGPRIIYGFKTLSQ